MFFSRKGLALLLLVPESTFKPMLLLLLSHSSHFNFIINLKKKIYCSAFFFFNTKRFLKYSQGIPWWSNGQDFVHSLWLQSLVAVTKILQAAAQQKRKKLSMPLLHL